MRKLVIRKATIDDLHPLQLIARKAFSETFSADNSTENLTAYLENAFSDQQLTTELQHPHSVFFLGMLETEPVGYLKINTGAAQTEIQPDNACELERIYVLADQHGSGIGQQLLEHALEIARQLNAPYLWLGVWEKNHRAIGFYKKNGFETFDWHLFTLGEEQQTDLLMRRWL